MVNIHHEELERQITNMMVMAIIDLEEHERTMVHIIYEREWMWGLGFSCVTHISSCVSLKVAN